MATGHLRIQLCGRVAVERDGERLEDQLPGRQGRLALAFLTLHRLTPIPRADLSEALWGRRPPAAPEPALNALLSKLRRVLGPDSIQGGSTMRITLPPDARIDLEAAAEAIHTAESALTTGELPRAWAAAQTAMFTARRGFLPGEEAAWIDDVRRDLDELHLRSLEAYGHAALGLGGAELGAAERASRTLTRLAPYRESGHRQLMRALAAQGNLAEALRAYDDLRRLLHDELGIPPSPATRELHEQLVTGVA